MSFFPLIHLFYWLALATWYGGVVFIVLCAQVIQRTVRESDPTLPTVLSVNLEGQHATLLAGSIVANILVLLVKIEMICAGVLLITMVGQWILLGGSHLPLSIIRTCLYIAAVAVVFYDWRFVSPRVFRFRKQYIDHADEPEIANPAREQFDRYHRESITVLMILWLLLSGLVLFSTMISTERSLVLFHS